MKLKCVEHGRRVVTISDHFVHRCGDGSRCNSYLAKIGNLTTTAEGIEDVTWKNHASFARGLGTWFHDHTAALDIQPPNRYELEEMLSAGSISVNTLRRKLGLL